MSSKRRIGREDGEFYCGDHECLNIQHMKVMTMSIDESKFELASELTRERKLFRVKCDARLKIRYKFLKENFMIVLTK